MKPLKPVMAAILAASSATTLLPGSVFATTISARAGRADDGAADQNSINELTRLTAGSSAAATDIAARLLRYMKGNNSRSRNYLADARPENDKNVEALVQDWAKKSEPGRLATLYFVVGPDGGLPGWAASSAVLAKAFKPGMTLTARMDDRLAEKYPQDPAFRAGDPNELVAFLNTSADLAPAILNSQAPQKEIRDSVDQNNTTEPQPPMAVGSAAGGGVVPESVVKIGPGDYYQKGAMVVDVFGPTDSKEYRTLSVKVYSKPDGKGHFVNQIGIVDITENDVKSPSAPKFYDMNFVGEDTFALHTGGRQYKIEMTNDGKVAISRVGWNPFHKGQSLATSVGDLNALRNEQIANSGSVNIDGEAYNVIGQGGKNGSWLFFKKGADHPTLMGDVSAPSAGGDMNDIDYKVGIDIGKIGEKGFHLEKDKNGVWAVKPGPGDAPKKDDDSGGDDGAAGGSGGEDGGKKPKGAVAKVVATGKKADWKAGANAGFDAETGGKVHIMVSKGKGKGEKLFHVFFDPSFQVKDNVFDFMPTVDTAGGEQMKLKNVRGMGKYVVAEFDKSTQYYTPAELASLKDKKLDHIVAYDPERKQMENIPDVTIAADILTRYMKVGKDAAILKALPERVAAHVPSGDDYTLSGNAERIILHHGSETMAIWPSEMASADKGTNEGMADLPGPGTVLDASGAPLKGSGPVPFGPTLTLPSGKTGKLVKSVDGIAIYEGAEQEHFKSGKAQESKLQYVMIDYRTDRKQTSLPVAVFGGLNRFHVKNYEMQGLPNRDLGEGQLTLMQAQGSDSVRGAFLVYNQPLQDPANAKSKNNCIAPVIWWGVSQDEAKKACAGDGKIR